LVRAAGTAARAAVVVFVAGVAALTTVLAVVFAGDVAAAVAVVGSMALMAMPVPSAVATPILSEAASARPRGAAWGRRLR